MTLRSFAFAILAALAVAFSAPTAQAFCGFYVAKADSKLYNKASKVVLAWNAGRTVITMASDYQGDPREFALVVPVPTFIERDQINVADPTLVDHLDAYTAPRLVEYFDDDPCRPRLDYMMAAPSSEAGAGGLTRAKSLGVTVEAKLHRRRIRHLHPLRARERRPRHLPDGKRLSHPRRRHRRARQLHQAEDAFLHRQGEFGRDGEARRRQPAAAAGGV